MDMIRSIKLDFFPFISVGVWNTRGVAQIKPGKSKTRAVNNPLAARLSYGAERSNI